MRRWRMMSANGTWWVFSNTLITWLYQTVTNTIEDNERAEREREKKKVREASCHKKADNISLFELEVKTHTRPPKLISWRGIRKYESIGSLMEKLSGVMGQVFRHVLLLTCWKSFSHILTFWLHPVWNWNYEFLLGKFSTVRMRRFVFLFFFKSGVSCFCETQIMFMGSFQALFRNFSKTVLKVRTFHRD